MEIIDLDLPGLKLVRVKIYDDERGFFKETYHMPRYRDLGIPCEFVQDNHSYSKKGVIRGMHFQTDPGQDKLVSVLSGEIYDVVVDIRPDSPTYKKWMSVTLDAKKHEQLFVPAGFAHGFFASEDAHVFYKMSSIYNPAMEKTFRFDDPEIAIEWPIQNPILSKRDLEASSFKEIFTCL